MSFTERELRLQARFNAIAKATGITVGEDLAFCAKMAAWGMVIDTILRRYLDQAIAEPQRVDEFSFEIGTILQTYHLEICDHLKIDPGKALDLVDLFREVMKDILAQRG
jgi:hypothetical protein